MILRQNFRISNDFSTNRDRQSAFTLLEVLLVMVILLILAGMSYPSIRAMYGDVRVRAASDQLRSRWVEARAHAIEEGQTYRFAIKPDTDRFRIAPDRAEYWNGGEAPAAEENGLPPFILEDSLTKGVQFRLNSSQGQNQGNSGTADSAGWVQITTLLSDGTAREDVTFELSEEDGRPIILKVRGMTGVMTVGKK